MTALNSQFGFLHAEISKDAARVEAAVNSDPRTACFYARRTLEQIVGWMYDNDADLQRPWETQLASLLTAPSFLKHVPAEIVAKARLIKDQGNNAVHGRSPVRHGDAWCRCSKAFA
jgi:type I restriction enzyme R subunit